MNPTRTSTWDHEKFQAVSEQWGDFCKVSRQLAEKDGRVRVTPYKNYRMIAERWVKAILNAYENGQVKEELEKAAEEIDRMIQ